MTTKQQRLKDVYEHLRAHYGIHTQIDFAEAIHITRPALSSAMNGNEAYLTKNLFQKICVAYPGVFSLDYLLTGEGSLLTIEEEVKSNDVEKAVNPPTNEMTANILEMYAQRVRLVDDLRASLKDELEEIRTIKAEFQQARDDFRDATYRLTQALRDLRAPSSLLIAAEPDNIPQND